MLTHGLLMSAALAAIFFGTFFPATQLLSAHQLATAAGSPAAIAATMDDSVAAYRKIIVLMDDTAALDEGNRERVRTAGWILFEKNRDRLDHLEQDLRADLAKSDSPLIAAFLTRLESNADFRDADKLAFRDVLDGLASVPPAEAPS